MIPEEVRAALDAAFDFAAESERVLAVASRAQGGLTLAQMERLYALAKDALAKFADLDECPEHQDPNDLPYQDQDKAGDDAP